MYFVSKTCYLCLCADKTLKNVFNNDEEQLPTKKIIANVIPELAILESEHPACICSTCYNTINSFYTFKKKCLENNDCMKIYTNQLQTSDNRIHEFRELKIKLNNVQITKKKDMTAIKSKVISKDSEDTLPPAQEESQDAFPIEEIYVKEESRTFENYADLEIYNIIIKEELQTHSENSVQSFAENNSESQSSDVLSVNSDSNENKIKAKTCETNTHNQKESICVKDESSASDNGADLEFVKEELIINSENSVENNRQTQSLYSMLVHDRTNENINAATLVTNKQTLAPCKNVLDSDGIVKFQCFICGKRFKSKAAIKKHNKLHLRVKDFKCIICGKQLARKSNLKEHYKLHTGVKEYKCPTCGKEFAHKSNLNGHVKCHIGVKEYKCFTCGKEFTHRAYLSQHTKFHGSVKDFKCFTCGKEFKIKAHLKRHVQTHINAKEYKCLTCGKVFAKKAQLTLHAKCHTNRKEFALRSNLTKHTVKLQTNVQNSNSELEEFKSHFIG